MRPNHGDLPKLSAESTNGFNTLPGARFGVVFSVPSSLGGPPGGAGIALLLGAEVGMLPPPETGILLPAPEALLPAPEAGIPPPTDGTASLLVLETLAFA